jgi:hypothetical protein
MPRGCATAFRPIKYGCFITPPSDFPKKGNRISIFDRRKSCCTTSRANLGVGYKILNTNPPIIRKDFPIYQIASDTGEPISETPNFPDEAFT